MSLATTSPPRYSGPPAVPGYVLDEFLGRGSCGVVWAACREGSGDRVAVKVVAPGGQGGSADPLAASDRERALGRAVETEHLVRALDRVALADGRVAIVLDLADGGSLRDVVTIRGALPLGEVVTALTPLASALAELHAAGIVHADLAPGNVLFTTQGRPLLADLASARLVDEDPWTDVVLGTPGFTAPETAAGGPPGPPGDVWSLGALAWYARTGGSPPPRWVGDLHWSAVPATESGETPEDVTTAVGPELRPVLLRMLADDPHARPTAAEAALALYRLAPPEPVGLVGHHPDPAAAVTNRIRREAAQTRSRSQLREQGRVERRRAARQRRRTRVERVVHPRATRRTAILPGRPLAAGPVAPARRHTAAAPRSLRLRLRLAVVAVLGLALAGGMLALLRFTGGSPLVGAAPLTNAAQPGPLAPGTEPGWPGVAPVPVASDPVSTEQSASSAEPSTDPSTGPSGAPSSENAAASGSVPDPTRDPVAALQQLADVRADALKAADPVALLRAEPAGSGAYQSDATTISRLREQRQRYAELSFAVRSAEVERSDASTTVLRAVVDRGGYTAVGEDGTTQTQPPAPGSPLRYTLTKADDGWRLTDVSPA